MKTHLSSWLPSRGATLLVILSVLALVWAGKTGALAPSAPQAPAATSTTIIPYQGKLSGARGPLTAQVDMVFRLYTVPSGSSALWSESWSAVQVTRGIFNVTLGSITPITSGILANSTLWLGIQVLPDGEMTPRVQLGAAPYAVSSLSASIAPTTPAKEGTFTRDLTLASGDQQITGLGFKPSAIFVSYTVGATRAHGTGIASSTAAQDTVYQSHVDDFYYTNTSALIHILRSNGSYIGTLKSFDANGFTITWAKTSAPTGVVSVSYLAFY